MSCFDRMIEGSRNVGVKRLMKEPGERKNPI